MNLTTAQMVLHFQPFPPLWFREALAVLSPGLPLLAEGGGGGGGGAFSPHSSASVLRRSYHMASLLRNLQPSSSSLLLLPDFLELHMFVTMPSAPLSRTFWIYIGHMSLTWSEDADSPFTEVTFPVLFFQSPGACSGLPASDTV